MPSTARVTSRARNRTVEPMLAVPGREPVHGDHWAYEGKWDGVRAIAHLDTDGVRLMSRNGNDITVAYPEIGPLAAASGVSQAIVDGELIATVAGRPSFSALQPRMHQRDPTAIARLVDDVPVTYVIFDLLELDDRSLLSLPYDERRHVLEALDLAGPSWRTPPSWTDTTLEAMLDATRASGLEGVIAKRRNSPYRPGTRSDAWRKFKHGTAQEFVVGGWTPGQGARHGELGALLVGYHRDGALHYAGKVGTGFDKGERGRLVTLLVERSRATCPFVDETGQSDADWVDPEIVVEVAFGEWTPTGHLRHPVYRGLRNDKTAREVTRE
ncbi:MAG TPA: non-homologous end-joining DNA ligase [Acidimicrobiales bacterium]|nr:non-homologous end-joining DNA ligase [Acidimicrobiales bacterium]